MEITTLVKKFNFKNRQKKIKEITDEFCRNENTICQECGDEFTPDGTLVCQSCRN